MPIASSIFELLKIHEGVKNTSYRCPAGKITIGVGHNIEAHPITITDEQVSALLLQDIADAQRGVIELFGPQWSTLNDVRRAALVDMCFNLGQNNLAAFVGMRQAIKAGDWQKAANHILNSAYAHQVGQRAVRISEMVKTGNWPES